jgi:hypothetical protein
LSNRRQRFAATQRTFCFAASVASTERNDLTAIAVDPSGAE